MQSPNVATDWDNASAANKIHSEHTNSSQVDGRGPAHKRMPLTLVSACDGSMSSVMVILQKEKKYTMILDKHARLPDDRLGAYIDWKVGFSLRRSFPSGRYGSGRMR